MSVLIKDMEMPIGCDGYGTECPLLQWGFGEVYCRLTGKRFGSTEDRIKYAKERPSDCPLVEIPPYGRLIDADSLMNKSIEFDAGLHDDTFDDGVLFVTDLIDAAPTVIEAEAKT